MKEGKIGEYGPKVTRIWLIYIHTEAHAVDGDMAL